MISGALNTSYRTFFPKDFINPRVKEMFSKYFLSMNYSLYDDIDEYINSTITKSEIPGLSDDNLYTQSSNLKSTGTYRTRTGKSGKSSDEIQDRNLDIFFTAKESSINWLIIYFNIIEHYKQGKNAAKLYLPNVHMDMLDSNGSILLQIIFKQITFSSLERMSFDVQNTGIAPKDFQLSLKYNDYDLFVYTDFDREKIIIV